MRIVECSSCGERQDVTEKCRKCNIQFGKVRNYFLYLNIYLFSSNAKNVLNMKIVSKFINDKSELPASAKYCALTF